MKDEKKGTQEHYGLQNINHIVGQIRDDIKNIKTQFENLPPVPEGKSFFNFLTEASFLQANVYLLLWLNFKIMLTILRMILIRILV